jgi:hypothetical protein
MQPNIAVSDLVRNIKANSSGWLKVDLLRTHPLHGRKGLAPSLIQIASQQVVNYILNQPEHHRKKTFREEYIDFFKCV